MADPLSPGGGCPVRLQGPCQNLRRRLNRNGNSHLRRSRQSPRDLAHPGFDDFVDTDGDTTADGCDICPGFDDFVDTDGDDTPDGCDLCPGSDDDRDNDGDGVPNGCDVCPGADDNLDTDGDGIDELVYDDVSAQADVDNIGPTATISVSESVVDAGDTVTVAVSFSEALGGSPTAAACSSTKASPSRSATFTKATTPHLRRSPWTT